MIPNSNDKDKKKMSDQQVGLWAIGVFIFLGLLFVGASSSTSVNISCEFDDGGNCKVVLQDQITDPLGFYMMQMLNNVTILIDTTLGSHNITLEPGHNFVSDDWICLQEDNHLYQAQALIVNGDTITFDAPLDFPYTTQAFACRANINMAVDGSGGDVIFRVKPQADQWTVQWDITRVICSISDGSAMDSSTFGGLSALTNGVVLRKRDGVYKNLWTIKTNGQYADVAYDVSYDDRAPAGSFGFRVRKTWAGQEKSGVAIRLDASLNESLEHLIQDDLSGLDTFFCRIDGSLTN